MSTIGRGVYRNILWCGGGGNDQGYNYHILRLRSNVAKKNG